MRLRILVLPFLALCLPTAARADDADVQIPAPVSLFDDVPLVGFDAPELRGELDEVGRYREDPVGLSGALEELLADEVEAAGGSIHASAEDLVVSGGAEVVDLVRRRVAAVDAFVQGRATLRIAAVHVDAAEDATAAAAVRAAVAGGRGRVIWSGRVNSRRGEPVLREVTDETTVVADFDVEVAESAAIADPIVQTLVTGWRLAFEQRAIDADSAFVALAFQLSYLASNETMSTGAGVVDRPRVPFVSVAVPLVLRRGEPQVVVVDHPWKQGSLAVVVEVLELPAAAGPDLRLIDAAALTACGLQTGSTPVGVESYREEEEETPPFEAAGLLIERLEEADAGSGISSCLGILRAEDFHLPRPEPHRIARRTWSLSAADLGALPGYDPLDGSLTDEAVAALAGRPAVSWVSFPTVAGAQSRVFFGTWTRAMLDVDVEIANTAAITDPIVYTFVAGDLIEVSARDASHRGGVLVGWSAARGALGSPRSLVVRKDIQGHRVEEQEDQMDDLPTRNWSGRTLVGRSTPAEVRLTAVGADVDVWRGD